jgi:capsular polysaccharide biosynthesis protein
MAVDRKGAPQTLGSGIYEAVNPLDLPRIDRLALTSGSTDGIYVEPPGTPREFRGKNAAFLDDPDQVGLFSKDVGSWSYWYPPAYTASISNATLVGYRTILTSTKQFFTDEAYVEPSDFQHQLTQISTSDSFWNEGTGLRPTDREGYFRFDSSDRAQRHVEGNVIVLCAHEPFSYGSFLFRIVPKIKAALALGLSDAKCIAYADPKVFRDLLILCGISKKNILQHDINAVTRIDRAIVPSLRSPHGYLDPESFEFYAELRASFGVRPTGRKIYVSRLSYCEAGLSTRMMVNEGELIARLKDMGFDIIEPEKLSVREQIKAFSSASLVVGPSGSGFFNTIFCHPGTKLIDLQSEEDWIYCHTGMYSSMQLNYGIFVGKVDPADPRPVHRRWAVNIDALIARIRVFMAE